LLLLCDRYCGNHDGERLLYLAVDCDGCCDRVRTCSFFATVIVETTTANAYITLLLTAAAAVIGRTCSFFATVIVGTTTANAYITLLLTAAAAVIGGDLLLLCDR